MSRPSLAPSKSLLAPSAASSAAQLTEELEKLEQSITLTLQEIDGNFAKAHRIITTSVLPAVERYAKGSEGVWEGSKFWKRFFEISANVSLANYAEGALEEEENTMMESEVDESVDQSVEGSLEGSLLESGVDGEEDVTMTPGRTNLGDEAMGSSPEMKSTPRANAPESARRKGKTAATEQVADYPSPYENMRRELRGEQPMKKTATPITPGKRPPALPDMSMTTPGSSSPFGVPPESAFRSASKTKFAQNKDTILHQGILGKTYRVGFTPMATGKIIAQDDKGKKKPTGTPVSKWAHMMDETLSSPEEPTPQLRAELFSSPVKSVVKPRVGYSVQTPGRKNAIEGQRMRRKSGNATRKSNATKELDTNNEFEAAVTRGRAGFTGRLLLDDSDDDELPEMSPLKTMQIDFGEQRVIQTPAREASRRIVQDLLFSAGDEIQEPEEYSPSIVVKGTNYQDDTF